MDRLTVARRSALMARVGSKHTTPELLVRKLARALGYRYRLHKATLPGKPDLAFLALRKAIFVHGCFWHGHARCRFGRLPRSNLSYWAPKIARNKERDRANTRALRAIGWNVLVIWQCETRDQRKLLVRLRRFLAA
jgi:DNA mismatch endonuclease (patch repair protein)